MGKLSGWAVLLWHSVAADFDLAGIVAECPPWELPLHIQFNYIEYNTIEKIIYIMETSGQHIMFAVNILLLQQNVSDDF